MGMPALDQTTLQACLDAVDGVAYVVGTDGIIRAVGYPGWLAFAAAVDGGCPAPPAWIGRSLFAAIAGDAVQGASELMHRRAIRDDRRVSFTYRCDAPEFERHMRLSLAPLRDRVGRVAAVLYQSVLLSEVRRPAMGMFARGGKVSEPATPLTLCSYCHDVAWPIGSQSYGAEWIPPDEYYRRGGGSDVLLSHGICPRCHEQIVEPNQ